MTQPRNSFAWRHKPILLRPRFCLLQHPDDLFFRKLLPLHALLHNSGRVTDRSQSCLNAIEFALTQACPGLTYDSAPHI